MKGKWKAALAILVIAACGRDGAITEPRESTAPPPITGGVLAIGVDTTTGANIETNKDDYSPGEIVHVVGRGWAPGETVNLHMTEEPNTHADVDTNVVADSIGGFSVHYYDVQVHDVGAEFTLTATGSVSRSVAIVKFTDGTIGAASIEMREATCTTPDGSVPSGTPICAYASFTITGGGETKAQFRWKNPAGTIVQITQRVPHYPPGTSGSQFFGATYTPTDPGTWTVLLCQSDDVNPAPSGVAQCASSSQKASQTFEVTAAAVSTTTQLAALPTPSVFGQSVTFTATVAAASGPAATGTVNFYEFTGVQSCSSLGGATLLGSDNSAPFEYVTSSLSVGVHTITGCYVPNAGWSASNGSVAHTVNRSPTTTTLSGSPDPSTVGQNVAFTATVAASGGGAGTPTGTVGLYEFTGVQNCAALGGAVSLGSGALASGSVIINVSSLAAGAHTITACYGGDANFEASTGSDTHDVNLIGTTTDIASSANPSVTGQTVTFTATVTRTSGGAPVTTGNITFKTGGSSCSDAAAVTQTSGTPNGSGQLTWMQSFTPAQNNTVVRACYTEGITYGASEDAVTQQVNPANTTTVLSDNSDPTVFGESVTFTAVVTIDAPGAGTIAGTVRFYEFTGIQSCSSLGGAVALGTDMSAPYQFTTTSLSVGAHTITACYEGNADFNPSSDADAHQVNKAQTTLSLSTNTPKFFGQTSTFTATVSVNAPGAGTPTGVVNFAINGTCQADGTITGGTSLGAGSTNVAISGGQAQFSTSTLNAGTYTIVACYGGDGNFFGDGDSQSHTVNPAVTQTVLGSSPDPSVFGNPVTFTATVSIAGGQGAGVPTGTVYFRLGGADCTTGTLLGSDPVDGSGQASIIVTSALLNVAGSPHTVRACFDNADGNFTDSSDTDTHTVNAVTTSVTASVQTTTPQYSDESTLRATITPLTVLSSTQSGTVHFYVGAAAVTCGGAPPAGAVDSDPIDGSGVAEIDYQVLAPAGTYTVTACFYSENANFSDGSDTESITITTEDASVTPAAPPAYGNAFPIASGGSASFSLQFIVREINPEPDQNAGALPGDIDNTSLTVNLNAVSSGANNESGTCTKSADVAGAAYAHTAVFTCSFTTVAVDAYEVVATVGAVVAGAFYDGGYIDVLTVYDPNAGFVTGGGKIAYPDASSDRVNFGLSFKLNANKPRGNLLVIRHLANGDVCRGKSNDIGAPAVNGNTASFSGKGNYGCTRPDGTMYDAAGNQNITGWVEDNGQGTNATAPDRFWIRVNATNSKLLMPTTASTNAQPLTGGNLQVPQPGGPKP